MHSDDDVDEADIPSFGAPAPVPVNPKGKQAQPFVPEQLAPPTTGPESGSRSGTPQLSGQIGTSSGVGAGNRRTVAGVRVETR